MAKARDPAGQAALNHPQTHFLESPHHAPSRSYFSSDSEDEDKLRGSSTSHGRGISAPETVSLQDPFSDGGTASLVAPKPSKFNSKPRPKPPPLRGISRGRSKQWHSQVISPDFRFPPERPFVMDAASSSNIPLDQYPARPPGMNNYVEDESDVDAPRLESSRQAKSSKLTVTLKSPRISDVRELSPVGYSHSRQGSESAPSVMSTPGGSDYGESDDDYDWSGEEDLVDEQAKFNSHMGKTAKREGWGIKRILHFLFSTLIGSILLGGILITPPLIVHFYWYNPNPTEKRRYIDVNIQAWLFWSAANVLISWFLAMIIDILPMLIRYFLSATWGQVSEAVKSRLETYDAVKDSVKPAFYAASALASWVIIFSHIYHMYSLDDEASSMLYTDRVYQVVLFFFFFTLVLCAQKMMSHIIAWNFHQTAYRERIEEVETALSVFEKLRKYQPKSQRNRNIFGQQAWQKNHFNMLNSALWSHAHGPSRLSALDPEENDSNKNWDRKTSNSRSSSGHRSGGNESDGILLKDIHMLSQDRNASSHHFTPSAVSYPDTTRGSFDRPVRATHSRTVTGLSDTEATLVQAAKVLKKAVLHDARNLQGRQDDLSGLVWNVNSSQEAKHLARTIYRKLKDRHRTYLVAADFYPAFSTREKAEDAFHIFDTDANGDLSRAEIKNKLVKTYQERRFLSRSLKDVGEALRTLDRIILAFAMVILFFISLSIFGVEVGSSLASVYSLGIAASFIFKSSASSAFDAIMFLFVTHPYDTGDRIFIDLENLVVKKVGLFATVFARSDGTETYYFNSQLFSKFITNARRSDKTTEMLEMQVNWKTPLTKLDALEKCLNDWLSTEEKRWFQPKTGVTLQHIEYQRYLSLTIGIPHNGNWQDWGLRNTRRTAFHAAVQYYCRQLGITGQEAPVPMVYSQPEGTSPGESSDPAGSHQGPLGSPFPLDTGETADQVAEEQKPEKTVKGVLGFMPPEAIRGSNMARVRKSHKSRKDNLGAMNAEC